ncbi:hypothetical protein [Fontivita pretiosa]|uniref:hypothetical protein n=1 Tax=Fontivita pretiosa TaxID=2989684 RepID=UPI003D181A47
MLEWQWSYVLLVGTVVACLGFLKWPRSSYELIHPRFVVPGIIWIATFGQAMVRAPGEWRAEFFGAARTEYGDAALWYTILAMLGFYLGMILPVGRWISVPFMHLETEFRVNASRLRMIGWIGTWALFAVFIAVAGPGALGFGGGGPLIPLNSNTAVRVAAVLLSVGSVFNAAMLGISWPEPHRRTVLTYVMMFVGLLVNSMCTMPIFSRGAGLAVFVAAMAYSIRVRRFRLSVMIPAVIWVALCAHAGLVGRGIHGRNSDVLTYLTVLFRYSIFDPASVLYSGFGLNDCFTSLAMSMKAITRADVRPLTHLNWILFQLPIPRGLGLTPAWTLDLTLYIGGYGAWGYTVGMLGDTYIHWKWFGPLWFIPVGIAYRFVSCLTFEQKNQVATGISAYSVVLFSSYYAIGVGVFNTYRAFVVGFMMPTIAVVLFLMVRRVFTPQRDEQFMPPGGAYQPESQPPTPQPFGTAVSLRDL